MVDGSIVEVSLLIWTHIKEVHVSVVPTIMSVTAAATATAGVMDHGSMLLQWQP